MKMNNHQNKALNVHQESVDMCNYLIETAPDEAVNAAQDNENQETEEDSNHEIENKVSQIFSKEQQT